MLVPYARETLEAAYQALHDDLGFDAELPIRLELYRSPSDLAAVSSLSQAEVARTGTIALCKWARLMVTTPRALAYGYPWLDSMNHELVHYAVSTLTNDRAPVWFQEGLAKFLERRWREPAGGRIAPALEHLLAKALRAGSSSPSRRCTRRWRSCPRPRTRRWRSPRSRTPSPTCTSGRNAGAARRDQAGRRRRRRAPGGRRRGGRHLARVRARLARVHGRAALQHLPVDRHPDHAHPQAGRDRLGAQAGRGGRAAAAPALGRAVPHLRLGNMLLQRDRPRAAVREYEKGAKALGPAAATRADPAASWLFPVKLGRTYLALGEPDRALKALAPVQALHPDLPWPHLIAGEALLAKGSPAEAIAPLKRRSPPTPSTRASTARWPTLTASSPPPSARRPRSQPRAAVLQVARRRRVAAAERRLEVVVDPGAADEINRADVVAVRIRRANGEPTGKPERHVRRQPDANEPAGLIDRKSADAPFMD